VSWDFFDVSRRSVVAFEHVRIVEKPMRAEDLVDGLTGADE